MSRVAVDLYYRDAGNYKRQGSHSFAGPLRRRDVVSLQHALIPQLGLVPSAVGLPDLGVDDGERGSDDHPWHDVVAVRLESGEPDDERTFARFVRDCRAVSWHDAAREWETEVPLRAQDEDEFEDEPGEEEPDDEDDGA